VKLNFNDANGNAFFDKPIEINIPIKDTNTYFAKVDHGNGATFEGLTLDPNSSCTNGVSNSPYK
jgi:hypothetical protein